MNASTVSRLLGKSFRKSNTNSSRVSGWSNTHEGFVTKQEGDFVVVAYELGDWNKTRGAERIEARAAKLRIVADYLATNGYKAEFVAAGQLLITAKVAA